MSYSKVDEALEIADKLIAQNNVEGYMIKGIIISERSDKEEGKRLLEFAAERGSTLAQLCLCVPGCLKDSAPDIERLKALADSVPIACKRLGDIYSGKTYDESKKDDEQAAFYYMKADEHALLGKFSARWLLNYHRNGGNVNLSEKDIERFEKLASMRSSRPEDRLCEEMEVETDEFDYDGIEAVDAIEVDTIEVE
jgi:TPR repeat protein